eukprot:CAMPEP_0113378200 /NCGR_PEP_ID=MMETSP0013_2-20120614/3567_1 /TAXON_ID=2843 ORGANISM="Skeletonema costatum, Strain 1716" /NCGR_SAMPLE_ID=MMETSP0013_2 /ASSEMBLY_ACC=CAM_ASM_000158 /LENGTH=420 /DNA_ID=CAMNT_0000260395 /DNA_START=50 /DNA_END=1309 /DNA_ORIENTATION=+ /assembly_acc=CAM_ASM_000158
MAPALRQRNNKTSKNSSSGRIRISLSLTCLLVTAFSISLIGLVFQFIAVHRIGNRSNDHINNAAAATSLMRGATTQNAPPQQQNKPPKKKPVIAYTVTITGCSEKNYSAKEATSLITQGAAVLQHSIHLAHTTTSSKYDYQMYAIIHPAATSCSVTPMKQLGYQVLVRNTPFHNSDIQTKFLRENIDGASCCGAKEFLKLYAYTLKEPIAVILDLDSLVLRPMDELFDVMLMEDENIGGDGQYDHHHDDERRKMVDQLPIHHRTMSSDGSNHKEDVSSSSLYNKRIDAFYTRDYNMINPGGEKYAGVQGGFLMLRPDEDVFAEYVDLVLQGNYIDGRGWGGKYGYFYGGAQVQGICSYYFGELHPEKGVELNRCRVNQMVDAPRFDMKMKEERYRDARGKCRDGREQCEDCRETDVKDIW